MRDKQLHKRVNDDQVMDIFNKYFQKQIKAKQAREYLGIKKSQFFTLAFQYEKDPKTFTIQYHRKRPTRKIDASTKENILKELTTEKQIVTNPLISL